MSEITEELNICDDAIAIINGAALNEPPKDLYIPPDALEVFLETFEGPLDLLLYLIKKQNLDILDIPVAEITRQYMAYVDLMKDVQLELAGEYLVMAAMLAEIKSRMMLPKVATDEDEEDPRAELIRRLQEYERFKNAAQDLDDLPRNGRDFYVAEPVLCDYKTEVAPPAVELSQLLHALKDVLDRSELFNHHHIQREALSVRDRMSSIISQISSDSFTNFIYLFKPEEGRRGIVVTFLAVLELIKESIIEIVQTEQFGPIHIKASS